MARDPQWNTILAPTAQPLLEAAQLDPSLVFSDPRIRVWRDLPERQNCCLDITYPAGAPLRLHIKRFKPPFGRDVLPEITAIRLLADRNIPTVPFLAGGVHPDGRGFLITRDLAGFLPADRALRNGFSLAQLAPHIASLARNLHQLGLHHQDLYLCHFFIKPDAPDFAVHLIDPGRVRPLPIFPFNIRWIVKDLAQLSYSATELPLPTGSAQVLLDHYFSAPPISLPWLVRLLIPLKVRAIARHDARLRRDNPTRNVSLD